MKELPTTTDMSENSNTTENPANEKADERLQAAACSGPAALLVASFCAILVGVAEMMSDQDATSMICLGSVLQAAGQIWMWLDNRKRHSGGQNVKSAPTGAVERRMK